MCVDRKYAVCSRFCTPACLALHWPRHVEWHRGKDAHIESVAASNGDDIVSWRLQAAENVATAKDEYERLVARAEHATFSGDPKAINHSIVSIA
jgi:hypothetical protein